MNIRKLLLFVALLMAFPTVVCGAEKTVQLFKVTSVEDECALEEKSEYAVEEIQMSKQFQLITQDQYQNVIEGKVDDDGIIITAVCMPNDEDNTKADCSPITCDAEDQVEETNTANNDNRSAPAVSMNSVLINCTSANSKPLQINWNSQNAAKGSGKATFLLGTMMYFQGNKQSGLFVTATVGAGPASMTFSKKIAGNTAQNYVILSDLWTPYFNSVPISLGGGIFIATPSLVADSDSGYGTGGGYFLIKGTTGPTFSKRGTRSSTKLKNSRFVGNFSVRLGFSLNNSGGSKTFVGEKGNFSTARPGPVAMASAELDIPSLFKKAKHHHKKRHKKCTKKETNKTNVPIIE